RRIDVGERLGGDRPGPLCVPGRTGAGPRRRSSVDTTERDGGGDGRSVRVSVRGIAPAGTGSDRHRVRGRTARGGRAGRPVPPRTDPGGHRGRGSADPYRGRRGEHGPRRHLGGAAAPVGSIALGLRRCRNGKTGEVRAHWWPTSVTASIRSTGRG